MLRDNAIRPSIHPDEPAISWLGRWARMTGYTSVTVFAARMGLKASAVAIGKMNAELAERAGLPADTFDDGTVRFKRDVLHWRGTTFRPWPVAVPRGRLCLECLRDDSRHAGTCTEPPGRFRTPWQMPFITACPFHGQLLLDAGCDGRRLELLPLNPLIDADPAGPFDASFSPTSVESCAAEAYLYGRLGFGPEIAAPILDRTGLSTLPYLLWNVGLWSVDHAPRKTDALLANQIMNAGYAALCDEEALGKALGALEHLRHISFVPKVNTILPEVREAVLRLPAEDTEAFREAAARYLVDRYPWGGPDRPVFGCVVPQRYYSLEDLYRITGIHHLKMGKLLKQAGVPLADIGLPGVDVSGLEQLLYRMQSLIGFEELQLIWSVTMQTARDLVSAELLQRWSGDADQSLHKALFSRDEADAVVTGAVGGCAIRYSVAPQNFLTLRQASARPGISQPGLVRDLLNGRLACAGLLKGKKGLSAILVRLEDFSDYVPPRFGSIVSTNEACRLVGVSYPLADSLARNGFFGEELRKERARLFSRDVVLQFAARYISGFRAGALFGTHARLVKPFLEEHGIIPLTCGEKLLGDFYARDMVMALVDRCRPDPPDRSRLNAPPLSRKRAGRGQRKDRGADHSAGETPT